MKTATILEVSRSGRRRGHAACAVALLSIAAAIGCADGPSPPRTEESNPFYLDPTAVDFSQNPELLTRVLSSPQGYLRFINIPFSQEVCRVYGEVLAPYPDFNLHGDAHVEQYAVTDLGRGLTDFDDSSMGPSLVDISRFAVSLALAADANGWGSRYPDFLDLFLEGYREALSDPQRVASEPAVATRLRLDFEYDREKYFEWIDAIAEPIPQEEEERLLEALELYIDDILARRPDLSDNFFEVQRVGSLKLGIGSALDRKYLVRIRGESERMTDDVVLELKTVRDLTGIDCVSVGQSDDPYRILMGQSIAYQPYSLLGYIRLNGDTFWVHAWVDNYSEVSVVEDFQSPSELAEVAYDVGLQLGRGHPNQLQPPFDIQLRREQLRLLDRDEELIRTTTQKLANQVREAWGLFLTANKLK